MSSLNRRAAFLSSGFTKSRCDPTAISRESSASLDVWSGGLNRVTEFKNQAWFRLSFSAWKNRWSAVPSKRNSRAKRGGGLSIPGDPGASRREEPCRARRRGRRRSPTKETRPRASRRALRSPSPRARRGASARSFLVFPLNLISKP